MGLFDFLQRQPKLDASTLMPWVHRRSHLEGLQAMRALSGKPPITVRHLNDAFAVCVAVPTDDGPVPLDDETLRKAGLEPDAAFVRACQNMTPHLRKVGVAKGVALFEISHELPGAVLLMGTALAQHLPLKGAPVAMLPTAGVALLAGEDDEAALALMLKLAEGAFESSDEYRSLRAVCWHGEAVARDWLPPVGHALRARFQAGAAETRRREALDLHQGLAGDAVPPVAPLAVVKSEAGAALVATWFRGASVVIPAVDRLVLLDTDDAPQPRLEVDFTALREACPTHLLPLSLEAMATEGPPRPRGEGRAFVWLATDEAFAGVQQAVASMGTPGQPAEPRPERATPPPVLTTQLVAQEVRHDAKPTAATLESLMREELASRLVPTRLFPAVRPPGYGAGTAANMQGMVQGLQAQGKEVVAVPAAVNAEHQRPLGRPGPEGLAFHLVIDGGTTMMPLQAGLFSKALEEAAWRTMHLNLAAHSQRPFEPTERAGVYEGPWRDDYDTSRALLLPALTQACAVQGEPLLFAPTVGRVWVVGSQDADGVAWVLDAIDALLASPDGVSPYQYRQMLFGWPWTVRDGQVVRWPMPEGFPHRARIEKLDAGLARRRQSSTQHVGAYSAAMFQHADLERDEQP